MVTNCLEQTEVTLRERQHKLRREPNDDLQHPTETFLDVKADCPPRLRSTADRTPRAARSGYLELPPKEIWGDAAK